ATRFHVHRAGDEGVVLYDAGWGRAARLVIMQGLAEHPIFPLARLQVADGARKGVLRRGLVGAIRMVCNVLPFAIAIRPVVDAKPFRLAHYKSRRSGRWIFLKAAVNIQDGISLSIL